MHCEPNRSLVQDATLSTKLVGAGPKRVSAREEPSCDHSCSYWMEGEHMSRGYYVSMVVNESTYCLHIYIYIYFYIYSGGCSCGILRFFSANWSVNVPQGGGSFGPSRAVYSTLHTILYTPQSSLPHFTRCTFHSRLHTLHCTLHTPHFTLYTLHPTLYTPFFTFYTLHPTLCTPHLTLYTLHSTLYTLYPTLYALHFTRHTSHFLLHALHFTLHTLHYPSLPLQLWFWGSLS